MILGHVIALELTVWQTIACSRAAGCARFAYNWGLAEWTRQYRSGGKPNANKLKKQFNSIKGTLFPWIYDSPKDANQEAFADLGTAFKNFFAWLKSDRKGPKVGYPVKKKKWDHDSFYVSNDKFKMDPGGKYVTLPKIGRVRIREPLRLPGKIMSARVTRIANRWYLSVQVECGEVKRPSTHQNKIIGIDLGIKTTIVRSVGLPIQAPRPLRKALGQLRRAQRQVCRRVKGSRNRAKACREVARINARVARVRKDFQHKVTTMLCRENQTVVIEDLNVAGMKRNRRLARALVDIGFATLRLFLGYKGPLHGTNIVVASRWFPSSKRCSHCGNVKAELLLSERTYRCDVCGFVCDRDLNAALNLMQYPGLPDNWDRRIPTPSGDHTSTDSTSSACTIVEVGTKPCSSLLSTS